MKWWVIYLLCLLGGIVIGHYLIPNVHDRPIIVEEDRP